MNNGIIKKLKREIRRQDRLSLPRHRIQAYNSMCAMPLGQRIKWAWGIVIRKEV